jgi:hypothetical protein
LGVEVSGMSIIGEIQVLKKDQPRTSSNKIRNEIASGILRPDFSQFLS